MRFDPEGVLIEEDNVTEPRTEARCATSGLDGASRLPWRYAHAAGIEGLHWDIYAGSGADGWLVASVGSEADAARIVAAVNSAVSEWQPDWRVHPGESLREAIEALGITQTEFARRLGVTPPFVSNILRGRKGIGPKVALKLEAAGVGPAQFWLAMQMQFDLHHAREQAARHAD